MVPESTRHSRQGGPRGLNAAREAPIELRHRRTMISKPDTVMQTLVPPRSSPITKT
jgi:hypothetical protein